MFNFVHIAPTKVYFGKRAEESVAEIISSFGKKRILLHYGERSAEETGLLKRIRWSVERSGAALWELGGVKPNPGLSLVEQGVKLCRENQVDLILAVGGGSVIDSAKAIGMGAACGGDAWDFYSRRRVPDKTVDVGVVLTISAAGSEMSNSSVITNDALKIKRGVNADVSRPLFAVMNPEITYSVPPFATACGCADIFMHTAERYLTGGSTMKITDGIAEALMTNVISSSRVVLNNPKDYAARADLMWAGSLSHNGLTGCGGDGGDWATHALGHELSALYDTPHGAALTAIWGSWARYVYKNCLNRFHGFAVQVMGVRPCGTREELALKGIEAVEEWFAMLKLPTSISKLGLKLSDEELAVMARRCAEGCGGKKGSCMLLTESDMLEIYKAAR